MADSEVAVADIVPAMRRIAEDLEMTNAALVDATPLVAGSQAQPLVADALKSVTSAMRNLVELAAVFRGSPPTS